MTKTKKILAILLLAVMLVGAFTGCNSEPPKSFQSMEDFKHARIGIMTGSSFDVLAKEYLPEADKLYFMNVSDLIMNLKQEKIDGILMDKGLFTPLSWVEIVLASFFCKLFIEQQFYIQNLAVINAKRLICVFL